MIKFGTLRLTIPFWSIALRAAALFVLVTAAGEALVRIPLVRAQLLLPVLPGHYELGAKEFLAERLYETNGRIVPAAPGTAGMGLRPVSSGIDPAAPGTAGTGLRPESSSIDPAQRGTTGTDVHPDSSSIDCFFIGNSIVGRGIIPEDFSFTYQAQTGQPITCFNFGIDSLTFKGGQTLIRILEKRYHPRLIVYGVHFENFTTSGANAFDLDTAWARNQLGEPNPEGWLESNLLIYRDVLTGAQTADDREKSSILTGTLSAYGYRPTDTTVLPKKLTPTGDPELFAMLDTLDAQAHRADLDTLLAMDGQEGMRLVLVDMPIPARTVNSFMRYGYDYQSYLDVISEAAQARGVVFIPAIPDNLIPEDGYQDASHMNTAGASAFSAWLGGRIGQVAQQGLLGGYGK